ncbi:ABC transporter ATP-binding protein [Limnohabitans sp. Bal53]|uniref:ABC transporter ATP-binding protein n=1 Tax=Limnohabitans sp. Bal53 TaxID=1977910 RepID=UPI000D376713|nr:ABC transporter ATP-binding protein [Limnohabitans sp. Bal53]PUE42765.1 ABC transporter ATP-binding protein [Limnohabitans sp. Bal53]
MSAGALLQVNDLVKQFGALRATDHVTLDVQPGEIHALIGPNGAGKTSLVAQLSGHLPSDSGQIVFAGEDVTALPTHERVRRGLARSFQITRLFKSFTVLDNVALSVQARSGHSFSFWRPVRSEKALTDQAMAVLQDLGLQDRAHAPASELSHGEQRVLELGLAVATRPKLLLLDEPMAGAGPVESERIVELIQQLRSQVAILLIEHDMDAVFRLADRISVLVNGALIATGAPEAIRHNPQVIAAYLGEEHA